jgi:hypothetical protein
MLPQKQEPLRKQRRKVERPAPARKARKGTGTAKDRLERTGNGQPDREGTGKEPGNGSYQGRKGRNGPAKANREVTGQDGNGMERLAVEWVRQGWEGKGLARLAGKEGGMGKGLNGVRISSEHIIKSGCDDSYVYVLYVCVLVPFCVNRQT